ncbi:hypothetical protein Tco_0543198 [Tanacetum coccineum]
MPEYKDTAGSKGKKEPETLVFHKMYTEESSDRYIAQCFVNGLYASDREINLEKDDNLISNDYAVKLYLEYEVRKGKKLVKKELMVLLRGEVYFVHFIINPEENEFEPGLIFRRSFLHSANAMVNFREGTITIQADFDPFLLSSDDEKTPNLDDLETLLDFNFDEAPQTETNLSPFVCKMGKGSRNKKKVMENIMYFNHCAGPSSSVRMPLTQEEVEKRALAHNISMRYVVLEEVRPVIETLAYHDKYRKLLDEIWADKVKLDGIVEPEEERVMVKTSGAYDHEAGSSRAKRSRNVETIGEALLPDVHHEFLEVKEAQSEEEIFFSVAWVRAFNIHEPIYPELYREFYATYEFDEVCASDELQTKKIISFRLGGRAHNLTLLEFARRLGLYHADELEEGGFDVYFQGGLRSDENFNAREYWERISLDGELHLSRSSITSVRFLILRLLHKMITYGLCQRTTRFKKIQKNDLWLLRARSQKDSQICYGQFVSKIAKKTRVLTDEVIHSLSTPVYCRDLDRTTLRELIDSKDRLILDILADDVQRVAAQRAPRVQRASVQDLYERMGSMEIRQEAIERMEYRHSYHWDRYQGVLEHMAGVYNVPL